MQAHFDTTTRAGARTFLSAATAEWDAVRDTTGIVKCLELAADRNVRAPVVVLSCAH